MLNYITIRSTFLTPAGGTVKAAAWSFDERVEWRATILNLKPVMTVSQMKKLCCPIYKAWCRIIMSIF